MLSTSVSKSQDKLSCQVKSYKNTGSFFFAASPKYSGMRTKRIPLAYSQQLKNSSIFSMELALHNFYNNTRNTAVTQVHKFFFCCCLQQNHHLNQILLKKC